MMQEKFSFHHICKAVSEYMKVDISMIYAKKRNRELVECRQLIYYFARKYIRDKSGNEPIAYQTIGNYFQQDHATIMYGVNNIKNFIKNEKRIKNIVEGIDYNLRKTTITISFSDKLKELIPLPENK